MTLRGIGVCPEGPQTGQSLLSRSRNLCCNASRQRLNLDVDIDPIEHGTGDPLPVPASLRRASTDGLHTKTIHTDTRVSRNWVKACRSYSRRSEARPDTVGTMTLQYHRNSLVQNEIDEYCDNT
jgi:hypothetical protein